MWQVWVASAVLLSVALGCRCNSEDAVARSSKARSEPAAAVRTAGEHADAFTKVDLLSEFDNCERFHHGYILEFGDSPVGARRHYRLGPFTDTKFSEHEGVRYLDLFHQNYRFEIWPTTTFTKPVIKLEILPVSSRLITLSLDGKRLRTLRMTPGKRTLLEFPRPNTPLEAGRHTVSLSVSSARKPDDKPFARLSFLTVTEQEQQPAADYGAIPTARDLLSDVVLDEQPRRSLALWENTSVSCPVRLREATELVVDLGFWGDGKGEASIFVRRDGEPDVKLHQAVLEGSTTEAPSQDQVEPPRWKRVRLDLAKFAGQLVNLRFTSQRVTQGGRVAFGEPQLVGKTPAPPPRPEARLAVLVIFGSVTRQHLPPWGPVHGLSAFSELAQRATIFQAYRAPTTLASGTVASMLTGLPPHAHRVEDQAARLPDSVQTISEVVKQAGGRTAMFTGVPTTFRAFGFDTGWDTYEMVSPVVDEPATGPLQRASAWLDVELEEAPDTLRLAVVHVRGAHPPWDIPKSTASELKPHDYDGLIDPRRGAITIGEIRARHRGAPRYLRQADWVRVRELEQRALQRQDIGLSSLLRVLRKRDVLTKTLLIAVGDVGPGSPPEAPYAPAGELSEGRLNVPLFVKFPGDRAGSKVDVHASAVDIASTVLSELGLAVSEPYTGLNLFDLSHFGDPPSGRPQLATLGPDYSTLVHPFRLNGKIGYLPNLCRLNVDPGCAFNAVDDHPIAGRALWYWTYSQQNQMRALAATTAREPAQIDPETAAALTVWGDIQ